MDTPRVAHPQLTLDVLPHPDLAGAESPMIAGTLKIAGEYRVDRDLNHGDQLMVVVQTADGEVLSSHVATVRSVTLAPIEDKDLGVIGTARAHRAKVTE